MNKVLGYFVFQNVGNGCLISKYSNWTLPSPLTECAKKLRKSEPTKDDFEGEYNSTWIENPEHPTPTERVRQATLTIKTKPNTEGIYVVEWSDEATFHGEGMLFNDLLVGTYWNDALINGSTQPVPSK